VDTLSLLRERVMINDRRRQRDVIAHSLFAESEPKECSWSIDFLNTVGK
jgi:hypothetical protein